MIHNEIKSFILAKEANGRAARTLADYRRVLNPFKEWCDERDIDMVGMSRDDVRRYVARLRARDLAEATVAIHVRNLRTFLRWCWSEGMASENLALAIQAPKTRVREELPLSSKEINLLVSACSGDPLADRDRALILFLLDTGMRIGEVPLVKREDVHLENGSGWVRIYAPKTGEYRFVILGQRTSRELQKYLDGREDENPMLWMGRDHPLATRGMYQVIKRRARAVGLEDRVHPHLFRKTFATNWLDNGGDPERMRVLMGWSPETLAHMMEIYVASRREHLEDAHAKAGPVDNLPEW